MIKMTLPVIFHLATVGACRIVWMYANGTDAVAVDKTDQNGDFVLLVQPKDVQAISVKQKTG